MTDVGWLYSSTRSPSPLSLFPSSKTRVHAASVETAEIRSLLLSDWRESEEEVLRLLCTSLVLVCIFAGTL